MVSRKAFIQNWDNFKYHINCTHRQYQLWSGQLSIYEDTDFKILEIENEMFPISHIFKSMSTVSKFKSRFLHYTVKISEKNQVSVLVELVCTAAEPDKVVFLA